jgi:hypothetical protein
MLAYFKTLADVPEYMTMNNDDVTNILKALYAKHPKVITYFMARKVASNEYNAAIAKLRKDNAELREDISINLLNYTASGQRTQELVANALMILGASQATSPTEAQMTDIIKLVPRNKTERKRAGKNYRYLLDAEETEYDAAKMDINKNMLLDENLTPELPRFSKAARKSFGKPEASASGELEDESQSIEDRLAKRRKMSESVVSSRKASVASTQVQPPQAAAPAGQI